MIPKRILVLYEARSTYTATVREYLDAFRNFSNNEFWFVVGTTNAPLLCDLRHFDAVLIHYSVRLSVDGYLSAAYDEALRSYTGLKIAIIQDEYENTQTTRNALQRLGISLVLNTITADQNHLVYPKAAFPDTEFVHVFTGYAPDMHDQAKNLPDTADRPILIGYRGRPLPYWYGELGQEKIEIGRRMAAICEAHGINNVDIKWGDDDRIYGQAWYDFTRSCRVMLGTESGCNVFDDHGTIRRDITQAMVFIPDLTFAEAHRMFIGDREGHVKMNQISPRVFEAAAFRTGLVLFEGDYSNVLTPDKHYIPLKKDFSNVDDVLAKVQDADYVRAMTERAHADLIASGLYGYPEFIRKFDRIVERYVAEPTRLPGDVGLPPRTAGLEAFVPARNILDPKTSSALPPHPAKPWNPSRAKMAVRRAAKSAWFALPRSMRLRIWPTLVSIRNRLNEN